MPAQLTIIMPSWNKEKYIAEALDSVFAQQTAYSYQIVVADDHSTDRTLEIVEDYSRRHPGVFIVLRSEANQKLFKNVRRAYAICKTPYFCVLDPDDYWTDPLKIQKALDFLNAHPDFTIYATDSTMKELDGREHPHFGYAEGGDSSFDDYLEGKAKLGCTQGSVYRNVVFAKGLPAKISGDLRPDQEASFRGDSYRNLIHLHEGRAHFVPEQTAVYRVTNEGLWQGSTQKSQRRQYCRTLMNFNDYFNGECAPLLKLIKPWERLALNETFINYLKWPLSRKARRWVSAHRRCHKLIMTLLVKDEEEIVETNIRYHCAMGVDGVIVTSHCSADRTEEILARLKKEGLVLEVIREENPEYRQSDYVDRMIRLAKSKYGADWVLNADADEFYYSKQLDLKKSIVLNAPANVIWVDSTMNYAQEGVHFLRNTYFVTRRLQAFEAQQAGVKCFVGPGTCFKVMHAARGYRKIYMGNHDVEMWHQVRARTSDIQLYHYSIRNIQGWKEKIARYRPATSANAELVGHHVKKQAEMLAQGELDREFEAVYGRDMLQTLLRHGVVTNDPSVLDFLQWKGLL